MLTRRRRLSAAAAALAVTPSVRPLTSIQELVVALFELSKRQVMVPLLWRLDIGVLHTWATVTLANGVLTLNLDDNCASWQWFFQTNFAEVSSILYSVDVHGCDFFDVENARHQRPGGYGSMLLAFFNELNTALHVRKCELTDASNVELTDGTNADFALLRRLTTGMTWYNSHFFLPEYRDEKEDDSLDTKVGKFNERFVATQRLLAQPIDVFSSWLEERQRRLTTIYQTWLSVSPEQQYDTRALEINANVTRSLDQMLFLVGGQAQNLQFTVRLSPPANWLSVQNDIEEYLMGILKVGESDVTFQWTTFTRFAAAWAALSGYAAKLVGVQATLASVALLDPAGKWIGSLEVGSPVGGDECVSCGATMDAASVACRQCGEWRWKWHFGLESTFSAPMRDMAESMTVFNSVSRRTTGSRKATRAAKVELVRFLDIETSWHRLPDRQAQRTIGDMFRLLSRQMAAQNPIAVRVYKYLLEHFDVVASIRDVWMDMTKTNTLSYTNDIGQRLRWLWHTDEQTGLRTLQHRVDR